MRQKVEMKLRNWIDENKLDRVGLSRNTNAISYLEIHNEMIDWYSLSRNPGMENLICSTLKMDVNNKINTTSLSKNPSIVNIIKKNKWLSDELDWGLICEYGGEGLSDLLIEHIDKVDWKRLSQNRNGINLLMNNVDKIDWVGLSGNSGDGVIDLLKKHRNKINWRQLSKNRSNDAVGLLHRNIHKIYWNSLSRNTNELIKKIIHKCKSINGNDWLYERINWDYLSSNNSLWAIELLKENVDRINWKRLYSNSLAIDMIRDKLSDMNNINHNDWIMLSRNPAIFTINYKYYSIRCETYKEDLIAVMFSPYRIYYYIYNYSYLIGLDEDWICEENKNEETKFHIYSEGID